MPRKRPLRLAIVVTHPIQYYVPLYRRLAQRTDVTLKVFYTWHGGEQPMLDAGFRQKFAWDVPLTDGYEFEVVPNRARSPGGQHFWGVRNPRLIDAVMAFQPDAVHLTGYAYASHLVLLRGMARRGVPVLFRGDSHLLGQRAWWKRWARRLALQGIFRYPAAFLYVGSRNWDYYRAYGVPDEKLFYCPHSIERERFAESAEPWEAEAVRWRQELGIAADQVVLLFAGKFEPKKQPVAFMQAVAEMSDKRVVAVMVGDGLLAPEVRELAGRFPDQFRVLPFQNQSKMPATYRLGDLFVLPSLSADETWGLAVNEAMACGRPVLVSSLVGCAPDVIEEGVNGRIFAAGDWSDFRRQLTALGLDRESLKRLGAAAQRTSTKFSIQKTEESLVAALAQVVKSNS